jgi:diguanylate cyclase (GGDEF)-like protein
MGLTLRQSLFRLLVWSIVVTAVVILINVWTATSKLVQEQLEGRLSVAENVFARVQQDRRQQLISSATVLAADFGFKQAVATRDLPTIDSALLNQSRRINADVMALLDVSGNIQTSEPKLFEPGSPFEYPQLVSQALKKNAEGIGVINGQLYQMILLPVKAPTIKGIVAIGFKIDNEFLNELKTIIRADLITYQKTYSGGMQVYSSTLDSEDAFKVLEGNGKSLSWADITLGNDTPYISRAVVLSDNGGDGIRVLLAADVTPQYRSFNQLQLSVITISIISILLSLGVSMLVSKRITEPLSSLIEGVKRIAAGDYGKSLDVSGKLQEIKHLASAFSTMQESIASREKRIRFQAQHDNLTNLYNRNYIKKLIDKKIQEGEHIQVIGLNVAGFRQINDLYGYENGDACLKRIAERLTRWPGEAARLSGSDMYWIPETPLDDIKLETLKYILEQPVETNDLTIPIKVSIGVMDLPVDSQDAEHLFRRMNIVIDESHISKQWLVRYTDDLETRYLRRLDIITELKRALLKGQEELSMVYQPKVCLATNKVKGVEALIRWNSRELGFVPPDEFITIAEQAGLIEAVTEWVMEQTIYDLSRMRQIGHQITVAINLSTQDIENSALLARFLQRLEDAGLTSSDIELEMTESDLVADEAIALENLESLRNTGFNVAIDDFGTGYSSLAYLKNLPVDIIKIDKSFVLNLAKSKEDQQIVNVVLKLAESFGLAVVAEGIEDEIAMSLLSEWGCTLAQGYHISRPLKYDDLVEWFAQTKYC